MTTAFKLQNSLLVLALTGIYPVLASATTSAGVAQFIAGDVNVRRPDGQSSPLIKGNDLESGQAIVTGATGRAQVRFSDGGLVSLQPNTEFKIANYVDKADPQQDRFLVDLLRGSMRAITGLIGKRNKDNYRVTTTTATIGIRGSGFTAGYNPDGSLNVTAEKDGIEVCSGGVCVGLVAGESATVKSSNEPPVRTNNRASIPTPPPVQEVVTIGNRANADGSSSLIAVPSPSTAPAASSLIAVPTPSTAPAASSLIAVPSPSTSPATFVDRTFNNIKVIAVATTTYGEYQSVSQISSQNLTATEFRNNKLLKFTDDNEGIRIFSEAEPAQPIANFNSIGNVTDPDFVGWGMWTTGTKVHGSSVQQLDRFHYVAGRPTSQADMTAFMGSCSNCIYNYSLIGSTAPTLNGIAGILNSASFSVIPQYGSYYLDVAINTSHGNYAGNSSYGTGAGFQNYNFNGSFFGSNAGRAGLTYGFYPPNYAPGKVTGALVFQKPATSQPYINPS